MVPEVDGDREVVLGRLDRSRLCVCLARAEGRGGGGRCGAAQSPTRLHRGAAGAGWIGVFRQSDVPQGVRAHRRGSTQGRAAGTLTAATFSRSVPSAQLALRAVGRHTLLDMRSKRVSSDTALTASNPCNTSRLASTLSGASPDSGTSRRYLASTSAHSIPRGAEPRGKSTWSENRRPSLSVIVTVAP